MRNFEILRYLSKWKYLIFIISVLGAFLVYKYAMYNQEYTAQTIISYTNPDAANGYTPNGVKIDATEIYSSAVITGVLEDMDLNISADTIRSRCQVEEIIPLDEETRKEAILDKGEEYEYFPTDYLVSYSVDSTYTRDFARSVLDSIIKNYFRIYGEKYINQQVLPNNMSSEADSKYDYIEQVEILDTWVRNIQDYLFAKRDEQPDFRSSKTGYSFEDLYETYKAFADYNIPQIYSLILEQQVSVDKETLIKKYQNDISQAELDIQNMNSNVADLEALVQEYSNKNKEGAEYHYGTQADGGNESTDYILKDVYEDWYDDEKHINSETTYDSLVYEYVDLVAQRDKAQVDLDHKRTILEIFTSAPQESGNDNLGDIEKGISELSSTLDEMYTTVSDTVDEYNEFVGAYNLSTLVSINTREKINVRIYIVLALLVFFLGGCIGAIILGRSKDFLEYLMYTDRKTGVANRAKCDLVIEQYDKDKLKDSFAFLVIRIVNLKYVNDKGGRAAGDNLLKVFGRMLKRAATSYGFVGYNGSDQFFGMFEDCTLQRAEDFASYLQELIAYNNAQNPGDIIEVSVAIAESTTENIYDIRKLMGAAFRKSAQ